MRIAYRRRLNKVFSFVFQLDNTERYTAVEDRSAQRPKRCGKKNKYENNPNKNSLNNNLYMKFREKIRQLMLYFSAILFPKQIELLICIVSFEFLLFHHLNKFSFSSKYFLLYLNRES